MSGPLLRDLQNTRLSDIIARNTDLKNVQQNVFFFKAEVSGTLFADLNANQRVDRGEQPLAGFTVQLVSQSTGETIATTRTNRDGRYLFDVQSGVRTDSYFVRVVADPAGNTLALQSRIVQITAGDQFVRNLDIGVPRRPAGTAGAASTATAATTTANEFSSAVDMVMNDLQDPKRKRV